MEITWALFICAFLPQSSQVSGQHAFCLNYLILGLFLCLPNVREFQVERIGEGKWLPLHSTFFTCRSEKVGKTWILASENCSSLSFYTSSIKSIWAAISITQVGILQRHNTCRVDHCMYDCYEDGEDYNSVDSGKSTGEKLLPLASRGIWPTVAMVCSFSSTCLQIGEHQKHSFS